MVSTFDIVKMNFRGEGLGANETQRSVRIANALVGEKVTAKDASLPRRKQALLDAVLSPSPLRCEPVCPHWARCAACQFQCFSPDAEIQFKFQNWLSLVKKFIDIPIDCTIEHQSAAKPLAYRNRTEALVFGNILGLAPRSDVMVRDLIDGNHSEPIPMHDCCLHAPEVNALIAKVAAVLNDLSFRDGTRFSFEANDNLPREALTAGTKNARLVISALPEVSDVTRENARKLSQFIDAAIIYQELPPRGSHVYPEPEQIAGSPWYVYDSDHLGNALGALKGAWTPVNPANAHHIRNTLIDWSRDFHGKNFLEIGCGCGTHSSVFSTCCEQYTGIDASWRAIRSAQHNAEINRWKNTDFFTDTAQHYLDKRYYRGVRADAILLHSNRMPYDFKTAQHCLRFGAKRIYIVAPTAYALAQECRHFLQLGCALKKLLFCDTLPKTYHMMGVAMFQKK